MGIHKLASIMLARFNFHLFIWCKIGSENIFLLLGIHRNLQIHELWILQWQFFELQSWFIDWMDGPTSFRHGIMTSSGHQYIRVVVDNLMVRCWSWSSEILGRLRSLQRSSRLQVWVSLALAGFGWYVSAQPFLLLTQMLVATVLLSSFHPEWIQSRRTCYALLQMGFRLTLKSSVRVQWRMQSFQFWRLQMLSTLSSGDTL